MTDGAAARQYVRPARSGRQWLRETSFALSVAWLALVIAAAVTADWLPIASPYEQDLGDMLMPPSLVHPLGTDSLGRDLLARSIFALRISMVAGLGSVALGILVGGTIGLVAGYFRGRLDVAAMAAMNVVLAFPPLVLAIAITSGPGPQLLKVIVAIGVLFVPAFARLARANTLALRNREFVTAAEALGMRPLRVMATELLPNLVPPLLAYSLLMVAVAIVAEASLSFLGLSVPPPAPSLGSMIASEQRNVLDAPFAVFCPAGVLFLVVLSLNLVGERMGRLLKMPENAP